MATLKPIILHNQSKKAGECNIYIRVTSHRTVVSIKTDIFVLPDNFRDSKVIGGKNGDRNAQIKNIRISEILTKYEREILDNPTKTDQLDALALKNFLIAGPERYITDFFKFTEVRLEQLKKSDKKSTIAFLSNTLERVKEFHKRPSLNFSEITPDFLEQFCAYYLRKNYKMNTVAIYCRYIRTMFNLAIDEYNVNIASPVILNYPFRKFKIATEPTQNRNLSIDIIRAIRDFKTISKREEITRDIFMLQMFLAGINIKDLFYLKPAAVIDNRLQFSRFKTGRFYNIKIEPEAQEIMNKYKGEKYLLWFADYCMEERSGNSIKHSHKTEFQYANQVAFNKMLNVHLKTVEDRLKLKLASPLTTYWARHSFATVMREIGISKDDISLCLGHINPEQNLRTSGIYIKEDFLRMDIANRKLIDFIIKDIEQDQPLNQIIQ